MRARLGADAIDSVTAIAERDGCAPLPALTQADLCALGAADKALLCQRTWDWWLSLGETGRAEASAKSLDLLAFRKLILPARGAVPAVPVPELGLILAARSSPEPLVTCQVPGLDATRNPRFFGMTQQGTGLRVLVCELLTSTPSGPGDSAELGTILSYALVTPAYAATMLAAWARIAGDFASGQPPAVDIYARDPDGRLALDRYQILREGELFRVRRPATALTPQRLDEMLTAKLLTAALIRAAMSGHQARPEVAMPQRVIYGEDHSGVRWQMVTTVTASWVLVIGGGVAASLPHLEGFAVVAIIGGVFALIYTLILSYSMAVGVRVYDDSIQIGGLRGRDRRLRRGTWPPRQLPGSSRKAVFICPWQAADSLYVLTQRPDIQRIRQDAKQFRARAKGTKTALGVFDAAAYFADAFLVISNDPSRTESEPPAFGPARGRDNLIRPVASPTWLVPIRDPGAFLAAVRQLPQAPPLHDRLPEGHAQFEARQ